MEEAIGAARAAQPSWGALAVTERARALDGFRRALFRRRREVADIILRENGKPPAEALATEVLVVLDVARYLARAAPRVLASESLTPFNISLWRKRVRVVTEPLGVAGVISPWNYPLQLAAGMVLPALVAGNGVVLKPSEYTPTTAMMLGELLVEGGVPPGLIHVIPGNGETGAALVRSGCDKIFFTGSEATGKRVAAVCAERLIPYVLELGASDPAIVLDDADLDLAASGIAWGRFSNAGQTCVAPKRAIVVEAVYTQFVERLARAVQALHVGAGSSPTADVGPVIRPSQLAQLRAQLADALERGARVAATAEAPDTEHFFPPTVLVDVTPGMRVLREETFGPILPVVRVPDADAAVAAANDTVFGLEASIWSRDRRRAEALASRLETGTVVINDVLTGAGIAEAPRGGVKHSGHGRVHGRLGLLECVRTKTIVTDRLPFMRQPWWFGYGAGRLESIDAFARFWHGESLGERLGAVRGVLKLVRSKERRV